MKIHRFGNKALALVLAVCFVWVGGIRPEAASALPSESMSVFQPAAVREAQVEKVMGLLSRPDAKLQLHLAGISRQELRERLDKMDDSQLEWAAQRADQVKAGGVWGIVVAVLVIAILVVVLIWLVDAADTDVDID